MKNAKYELKNWQQLFSPSHKTVVGVFSDYVLSGKWISRHAAVRCGQVFVAALFAGGFHFLALWSGDRVSLLAAFAATSALAYIGLAIQSRTATQALLNVIAVPTMFIAACAGFNVATEWLTISFVMHGIISAVQIESVDKDLRGGLFLWSVFNSAMAILLLLG